MVEVGRAPTELVAPPRWVAAVAAEKSVAVGAGGHLGVKVVVRRRLDRNGAQQLV